MFYDHIHIGFVVPARVVFTFLLLAQKKSNKRKGHPTPCGSAGLGGCTACCVSRAILYSAVCLFSDHTQERYSALSRYLGCGSSFGFLLAEKGTGGDWGCGALMSFLVEALQTLFPGY